MSSTIIRSIDVDKFSDYLYLHYKARYELYHQLTDDPRFENMKDDWIKKYKDHSYISETGYLSFDKEERKKIINWVKNEKKYSKINGKLDHRLTVDFFSKEALEKLKSGTELSGKNFCFEHMVPKKEYIQNEIEKFSAKNKENLGEELHNKIRELIEKYYFVCLITKEEDRQLSAKKLKNKMPEDWDKKNIKARYIKAGIETEPNLFLHKYFSDR